jgi:hypothetical protein
MIRQFVHVMGFWTFEIAGQSITAFIEMDGIVVNPCFALKLGQFRPYLIMTYFVLSFLAGKQKHFERNPFHEPTPVFSGQSCFAEVFIEIGSEN